VSESEPIVGAVSLELQTCRSEDEGVQTMVIPSFRDYGNMADFDFWELFDVHLKVVSDHQLNLMLRLIFERLRKGNATTDYIFYICGNHSNIEGSERYFPFDSPLCIFDASTGRTYIRVELSDLNFVSLSVHSLNSKGMNTFIGMVASDGAAVMKLIKRMMKFNHSDSEPNEYQNLNLIETNSFEKESDVQELEDDIYDIS
jgi:hypothetical protein